MRPGRKIGVGERLFFGGSPQDRSVRTFLPDGLMAEVVARGTFGERRVRFSPVPDFLQRVERIGHVPLPPYISRQDCLEDRERYQTVYARKRGSVAAPTAGLHFTPEILDQDRKNVAFRIAEITLHVGLGTFQPVRVEKVEEHRLHREDYEISAEAAEKINRALDEKRRMVAIGTTTVRTLEFSARRIGAGKGSAGARRTCSSIRDFDSVSSARC